MTVNLHPKIEEIYEKRYKIMCPIHNLSLQEFQASGADTSLFPNEASRGLECQVRECSFFIYSSDDQYKIDIDDRILNMMELDNGNDKKDHFAMIFNFSNNLLEVYNDSWKTLLLIEIPKFNWNDYDSIINKIKKLIILS